MSTKTKTKTTLLATLALLITGCTSAPDEDSAPQAPEPIGAELLRVEGTWAAGDCVRSHLYREGRAVQHQCFDGEGVFSWENRGMLTVAAAAALDDELAAADLDDTDPVNYMGLCSVSDAHGVVTMWVGERHASFAPFCLFTGILNLYTEISAVRTDIEECQKPFMRLESLEPGCRAY